MPYRQRYWLLAVFRSMQCRNKACRPFGCLVFCKHKLSTRTARVHRQKFDERYPALKDLAMEYTWAGHLCLTRNGVAVMRELDRGLYSACVQNGLGTVRGTLTGIGAAELASGVTSEITKHFLSEAEPTLLPPPPISTIGANAYLRWREYKATHE